MTDRRSLGDAVTIGFVDAELSGHVGHFTLYKLRVVTGVVVLMGLVVVVVVVAVVVVTVVAMVLVMVEVVVVVVVIEVLW